MKIYLTPSWELSTEHPASSYRFPVLVNRATNEAYGPKDIVNLYPSWGYMTGSVALIRIMKRKKANSEEIQAAKSFLSQWPDGPQIGD